MPSEPLLWEIDIHLGWTNTGSVEPIARASAIIFSQHGSALCPWTISYKQTTYLCHCPAGTAAPSVVARKNRPGHRCQWRERSGKGCIRWNFVSTDLKLVYHGYTGTSWGSSDFHGLIGFYWVLEILCCSFIQFKTQFYFEVYATLRRSSHNLRQWDGNPKVNSMWVHSHWFLIGSSESVGIKWRAFILKIRKNQTSWAIFEITPRVPYLL